MACRYRDDMAGPVTARPDEPAAWIRSGEDRAIPSKFCARTEVDGFTVTLHAVVGQRGPGAVMVKVEQPVTNDGPPVTLSMLRKVTVDQIIRDALTQLSRPVISAEADTGVPTAFRVEGVEGMFYGPEIPDSGRRPAADKRLERVAEIYLRALAEGRPPVKAVTEELPASRSTAGRLVGQARKAGLLAGTTRGKRGTLADLSRLARKRTEAGGDVEIVAEPGTVRTAPRSGG